MKIKNKLFEEKDFIEALKTLATKEMSVVECEEFIGAVMKAEEHLVQLNETRKSLIRKRCSKDKDGEPVVKDDDIVFPSEEEKKKCRTELNELQKLEFDFPFNHKIKLLCTDKLTPRKYSLLKEIIEIVDTL